MSRDALAVAFEAGASEELTGILRDLADATGPRGPRYAPQVIRRLSRMVAARSYGTALLELVHLLRAAEHVAARGGWPSLFWEDDDVSAAGFATRFDRLGLATARQSGGALSLTCADGGISLLYPGDPFTIRFSRMPVLAGMLDLLVSMIGWRALEDSIRPALEAPADVPEAGRSAAALSRRVYGWLGDHLPTAQTRRRLDRMIAFLRRFGPIVVDSADDERVLRFWEEVGLDPDVALEFRTWSGVARSFLSLRAGLRLAADRMALESSRPILVDRESGGVDPAEVDAVLETLDEREGGAEILLAVSREALKVMNKSEAALTAPVIEAGADGLALPMTVLRAEVFGAWQRQFSEALRRGGQPTRIADLLSTGPARSVSDTREAWGQALAHLERCRLALAHILLCAREPAAFEIMMQQFGNIDWSVLRREPALVGNGAPILDAEEGLHAIPTATALFGALRAAATRDPVLSEAIRACERAHRKISRRGFSMADLENPSVVAGAIEARVPLDRTIDDLARFLNRLSALSPDLSEAHAAAGDTARFRGAFSRLYGEGV